MPLATTNTILTLILLTSGFRRIALKRTAITSRSTRNLHVFCGSVLLTLLLKELPMLRAFCFAVGVFIALWGATFLMVDQMTFAWKVEPSIERDPEFRGFYVTMNENKQRVFTPPQWLAFCLMSVGSVTMLYSLVLPKKMG